MRILMYIHATPPVHWAGAETMIWEFGQEMIRRGHEVRCMARNVSPQIFEGVKILPIPKIKTKCEKRRQWFNWADIVWTHLGQAAEAKLYAEQAKKPLLHLVHNSAKITPAMNRRVAQGFIFNSEAMLAEHQKHGYLGVRDMPRPYAVVRPTIDPSKYKTTGKGNHYTLININENKGGHQFLNLAKKCRNWQFLAVEGMYGNQAFTSEGIPSNITYQPNTGDMVSVYNRTKALLIMSELETWGRTASEAMCNGIPVIYHAGERTKGLQEHIGDAGVKVYNRNDLNEWKEAIKEVNRNYKDWSDKALKRYEELGNDYDSLEALCNYMFERRLRTVRIA